MSTILDQYYMAYHVSDILKFDTKYAISMCIGQSLKPWFNITSFQKLVK